MADPVQRIQHVVVLMLENHSFDHLLGFLQHPRAAEFDGLQPGQAFNVSSDGSAVYANPTGEPFGLDPDHSHEGAVLQLASHGGVASNGGFVLSYEGRAGVSEGRRVMECLDPAVHCPVLSRLALEFAVCTAWFCSVPGETWPNRNFAHAATSDSTVNIEVGFYYDPTIFELLERAGATWRIYYDGTPHAWCYRRLWKPRLIVDFVLRRKPRIGNWYEFPSFFEHVAAGDLPSYSFIEPAHNRLFDSNTPRQTNSQHPHNNLADDDDFAAGERLMRDVYEALRANSDLFEKTLLLITYDEHGGLYDHVPPPDAEPPGDRVWRGASRQLGRYVRSIVNWWQRKRGSPQYDFRRLGVRVPCVLVSPWIARHTIEPRTFDHASIPATLRSLFASELPPLTRRDRFATTFHHLVTQSQLPASRPNPDGPNPHTLPPLPDLSNIRERRPRGRPRAAPVTSEMPSELDEALRALGQDVRASLRRSPTANLLRRRAPARLRARGRARPEDVFGVTARGARRDDA